MAAKLCLSYSWQRQPSNGDRRFDLAPREPAPFGRRGVARPFSVRRQFASSPTVAPPRDQYDPEDVPWTGETEESLIARFVGPDWPEYRDLWRLMQFDGALLPSFSFAALSFSFAWLFYRRLYGAGLVAMAAQIATSRLSPTGSIVGALLLCLFIGFFGKALVIKKAMKTVGAMRDDDPMMVEALGGTRLAPAIFAVILVAAVGAVEVMKLLSDLRVSQIFPLLSELTEAWKAF